jgi:hypothetical protein
MLITLIYSTSDLIFEWLVTIIVRGNQLLALYEKK